MVPPIADPAWLGENLDEVVLAEVRWRRDEQDESVPGAAVGPPPSIPGAVLVDLDADLSDVSRPATEGRHPLPSPQAFAATMSRLGIDDDDTVVAYDDHGGAIAARLVWMLRVTGRRAALLDGGAAAWHAQAPADRASVRPLHRPATFSPRPWPADRLADADEVNRLRRDPRALVLDARAPQRFRGDVEPLDPVAGHIPGAVNAPHAANLGDDGRFRPPDRLRRHYEALGAADADTVVVHCGSGVTACHDVLALEHAGLPPPRLYVASWSGWCADPDRPVATGEG